MVVLRKGEKESGNWGERSCSTNQNCTSVTEKNQEEKPMLLCLGVSQLSLMDS